MTDVRGQKHPFQLSAVLSLIRQTVYDNFGNRGQPWSLVEEAIGTITQDLNSLADFAVEPRNVIRGRWLRRELASCTSDDRTVLVSAQAPWVTRVEDIRAIAAVNLDAERAVAKLNEEILMLVKGVKTRDQTIQESAAKIELMERRMETVKQQVSVPVIIDHQRRTTNPCTPRPMRLRSSRLNSPKQTKLPRITARRWTLCKRTWKLWKRSAIA